MPPITNQASAAEKIACFQAFFRGREDVYPRRFESQRTGKSGYQPACGNEWQRGICEKPRIKCSACRHQNWLPVSDDVIRWHLSGQDPAGKPFVMGIYPMLLNETWFFLVIDFDKSRWREDIRAVVSTCEKIELPVLVERSRSGNGGHLWFFFEQAIPAVLARKMGSMILTKTMEQHPDIGLHSYDRLFPNQDTLPKGGFSFRGSTYCA
jgi:hypothetical protein